MKERATFVKIFMLKENFFEAPFYDEKQVKKTWNENRFHNDRTF